RLGALREGLDQPRHLDGAGDARRRRGRGRLLGPPMSTLVEPRQEAPPRAAPALGRAVAVTAAAGAMVATLPGRTHGLGLTTEPLLAELGLGRVSYAAVTLWATLLGALACVPAGWLLDRLGTRAVLAGVTAALAGTVLVMSALPAGGWVVGV